MPMASQRLGWLGAASPDCHTSNAATVVACGCNTIGRAGRPPPWCGLHSPVIVDDAARPNNWKLYCQFAKLITPKSAPILSAEVRKPSVPKSQSAIQAGLAAVQPLDFHMAVGAMISLSRRPIVTTLFTSVSVSAQFFLFPLRSRRGTPLPLHAALARFFSFGDFPLWGGVCWARCTGAIRYSLLSSPHSVQCWGDALELPYLLNSAPAAGTGWLQLANHCHWSFARSPNTQQLGLTVFMIAAR